MSLSIPTTPTVATAAQVAAHQTAIQTVITQLEAAPQNVENAESYLDAKAELVTTFVTAKHSKTRLLEVAAVVLVFGFLAGWFLRALIG